MADEQMMGAEADDVQFMRTVNEFEMNRLNEKKKSFFRKITSA